MFFVLQKLTMGVDSPVCWPLVRREHWFKSRVKDLVDKFAAGRSSHLICLTPRPFEAQMSGGLPPSAGFHPSQRGHGPESLCAKTLLRLRITRFRPFRTPPLQSSARERQTNDGHPVEVKPRNQPLGKPWSAESRDPRWVSMAVWEAAASGEPSRLREVVSPVASCPPSLATLRIVLPRDLQVASARPSRHFAARRLRKDALVAATPSSPEPAFRPHRLPEDPLGKPSPHLQRKLL